MKRHIRTGRMLLLATTAMAALFLMAPAISAGPPAQDVPTEVRVEEGHKLFLVSHAVGVQIYTCNAVSGGFTWGFVAPRADLYDGDKVIITHFRGPSWQAKDGSTAVGTRVNGVNVDPTAIDWLLLSATSTAGQDGDRLAGTKFIQRITTTGGRAPAPSECNAGTVGTTVEIPYTADYTFWK
jgi:hypothetical protein